MLTSMMLPLKKLYADDTGINNITRLQLRYSPEDNLGWSQSTFVQFPNKFYLLDLFDKQYKTSYPSWHFDFNSGGNIPGLEKVTQENILNWAVRNQKYQSVSDVVSAGLQFNLTNIAPVKSLLGDHTQSFIQVFPLKNSDALGRLDIVHYYSAPLFKNLSIRGYNQYIIRHKQSNLFYPWADVIYYVNKKINVYGRISYLSSNDTVFGAHGTQYWLGIRVNISI